jgi:hypothetical protein
MCQRSNPQTRFRAIGILGLFLLVGCAENPPPPDRAEAQLCQNFDRFGNALDNLGTIDPQTTVGELDSTFDRIGSSFGDLQNASADVSATQTEQLEQAYRELETAIDNVPPDATLAEASARIEDELAAVNQARDNAGADFECPPGSS